MHTTRRMRCGFIGLQNVELQIPNAYAIGIFAAALSRGKLFLHRLKLR